MVGMTWVLGYIGLSFKTNFIHFTVFLKLALLPKVKRISEVSPEANNSVIQEMENIQVNGKLPSSIKVYRTFKACDFCASKKHILSHII